MKISARLKSLRHQWTATDTKACRTCGVLLLLFAAMIVLPPVLIDVLTGHGFIRRFWVESKLSMSPTLMGLTLLGGCCTLAGVAMLILSKKFQSDRKKSSYVRRLSGLFLLCVLLYFVCIYRTPQLVFPWKTLGISRWYNVYWAALFGLVSMEEAFVYPHAIAVFLLWCVSLFFAIGMLSPQQKSE